MYSQPYPRKTPQTSVLFILKTALKKFPKNFGAFQTTTFIYFPPYIFFILFPALEYQMYPAHDQRHPHDYKHRKHRYNICQQHTQAHCGNDISRVNPIITFAFAKHIVAPRPRPHIIRPFTVSIFR